MNILYISHLTPSKSEGPNNSVPAQVKAQSNYDNIFWWNLTKVIQDHWLKTGLFHGEEEYPNKKISTLPKPFNSPDLVVFESFYYMDDVLLSWECRRRKIPYIITTRGALTKQGQAQKRLKKKVANFFLFRSMVKHAAAIQFLTTQEYKDSGDKWNKHYFIIPNGTYRQTELSFSDKDLTAGVNGICIGRFDPYQKGLDLLLESVDIKKDLLRKNKISIYLYGPERMTCREEFIKQVETRNLNDILVVKDGVYGDEKDKVLRNADFYIMTSRYEGMPMSMIEAMSYGIPCFATRGSNMAEEIDHWKAGWACETSIRSITDTFDSFICDLPKLREYGNNALRLSMKFDWNEIGRNTHEEYKKILSRLL